MVSIYDQYARILITEIALGWILQEFAYEKNSRGLPMENKVAIGEWRDMADMECFVKTMNEIGADPIAPGRVELAEHGGGGKKVVKRWWGLRSRLSRLASKYAS